ncbi:MAG: Nucleoid-associated protein [Chlamydiae bacterium]|nr:Nucleoid-associated protein [Chlamydiota bacterium]
MGSGYSKKKKQAKMMQEQIGRMQDQMKNAEATGSAGNGLVTVTLDGEHAIKSIQIKPECVDPDDVEGLEDLIRVAHTDALKQLGEKTQAGMPGLGGLMGNMF